VGTTIPLTFSRAIQAPILGLSTFNKLLDLTDILISFNSNPNQAAPQHLSRLENWETSLATKFDFIVDGHKQMPLNPPALLLQVTYLCTSFTLRPSQAPIHQLLDLIGRYLEQLGTPAVPPLINCLLCHVSQHSAYATFQRSSQKRLQKMIKDLSRIWCIASQEVSTIIRAPETTIQDNLLFIARQVPTSGSTLAPSNPLSTPLFNQMLSNRQRLSNTPLDDLIPEADPTASNNQASLGMYSRSALRYPCEEL
jgi:hypothetical protein